MTDTIRTAEELAALPEGTVLRDVFGTLVTILPGLDGPYVLHYRDLVSLADAACRHGPLTVLHRPDLPTQGDLHAAVERVRGLPTRDHIDAYEEPDGYCVDAADIRRALDTDTEETP